MTDSDMLANTGQVSSQVALVDQQALLRQAALSVAGLGHM